jgi:hypothetical protein
MQKEWHTATKPLNVYPGSSVSRSNLQLSTKEGEEGTVEVRILLLSI